MVITPKDPHVPRFGDDGAVAIAGAGRIVNIDFHPNWVPNLAVYSRAQRARMVSGDSPDQFEQEPCLQHDCIQIVQHFDASHHPLSPTDV